MTLDELLRAAAEDVAGRAPYVDVDAAAVRARAARIRQRRRIGVVAGVAAATVAVTLGLQALGGDRAAPDPVDPSPTPSPSALGSADPVVTIPEIGPDDLRAYDELATVTNAQPGTLGATELIFEVPVQNRFDFGFSTFCDGDPDTWFVLVIGDTGASAYGPCDRAATQPFPELPDVISPVIEGHAEEAALRVRMFVTGPLPPQHEDCFEKQSPPDCRDVEPLLEPLETTDVTFGVSVYEYWAPPVAGLGEVQVSARAVADGLDLVLGQVLGSTPGQVAFTTTLPAAESDRLVTVLTSNTDAGIACANAASSPEEAEKCLPVLELTIGPRTVLLARGEFGDIERLAGRHGFFRVPAGADRRLEVRVASGDPDHVEYAALVFDQPE